MAAFHLRAAGSDSSSLGSNLVSCYGSLPQRLKFERLPFERLKFDRGELPNRVCELPEHQGTFSRHLWLNWVDDRSAVTSRSVPNPVCPQSVSIGHNNQQAP